MIAAGELPMVDCAIFADTGAEPAGVYAWLEWLEKRLPFPVHRIMKAAGLLENIRGSIAGGRCAGAPFYTESDSVHGAGTLRRQCTREFKIEPITKKLRELLGLLAQCSTESIGHHRHWGLVHGAIHAVMPERRVVGTAVTVAVPAT